MITAGTGPKPTESDTVRVAYRGMLVAGAEFERSAPEKPVEFPVKGKVIAGWTEALKLMPAGSKWEIVLPPALAYGERGYGHAVGPNETLFFEFELLGIKGEQK